MPKKRKTENNLGRLIKALGQTQTEFARILGVSASAIKKVVEGKRALSDDLRSRIYAETGIIFFSALKEIPMEFDGEVVKTWKKDLLFNEHSARHAAALISKLVELMISASSRPGVEKSLGVFMALTQALEKIKNEFHLEKHIDAVLRDRESTETKLYTVHELRDNKTLAEQTGFKDDPALKDEDKIPLTRTVGWLPAKDFSNILWQHRELYCEILKNPDGNLTQESKAALEEKVEQIQKQMNETLYASHPNLRPN